MHGRHQDADRIKERFAGDYREFYTRYLPDAKLNGGSQGTACCPFHPDSNPSLSINRKNGFFKCFGCDAEGDIFSFYAKQHGVDVRRDFQAVLSGIAEDFGIAMTAANPLIVKTYDYSDKNGGLLFQVCRMEPKSFRQRRPDGKGGWIWNLKGVVPVLYRLPELLKAKEVIVSEGEKDCDNLRSLDFTATCNPGGAGKWRPKYSEALRGKRVLLCGDNDEAGRRHVALVGAALQGIAASVRVLELPGLGEKKDVSDFIARQPDRDAAIEHLSILIENAPAWTSAPAHDVRDFVLEKTLLPTFKLTDLGNAERLVNLHGPDLRYCYPWGKWLVWAEGRWTVDCQGEVERRAKKTVRAISHEITPETDENRAKELYKHAASSESVSRQKAMVEAARSQLPVMPEQLDREPYLFNVINGTVDLRTGKLYPHRREDMLSKLSSVEYDLKADCPAWCGFLDRIFGGNSELISHIQRVVGYALTGATTEQCFFLLYGTGANGKSTFLEVIRALIGEYGQQADCQTFLVRRVENSQSNDIASLKGARVVTASEAGSGRALNEALIKTVTGGEPVRARFLYGEYFEFKPQFKLFLRRTTSPGFGTRTSASGVRVRLIPFEVTIPPDEQDPKLLEKLTTELPGILNWALAGCRECQRIGLAEPDEVQAATNNYRVGEDLLASFFEDACTFSPACKVRTGDLKEAYSSWCEKNSEDQVSWKVFASHLEARGCKPCKSGGSRFWRGLGLAEQGGTSGT